MSDPCAPFRELLSAELDGELTAGEEPGLLEHLAGCSVCQRYRGRLKKTVGAVRSLREPPLLLVDVPQGVEADLAERLVASDSELAGLPQGPCDLAREQLSAQLDGELSADEEETLLAHLAGCSACQLQRKRLRRMVDRIRGAGVALALTPPNALELLDARLREETGEALQLKRTPEPAEPTPTPFGSRRLLAEEPKPEPAGIVLNLPTVMRIAAAASILGAALTLAYARVPAVQQAFLRVFPRKVDAKMRDDLPPEPELEVVYQDARDDPQAPRLPDPSPEVRPIPDAPVPPQDSSPEPEDPDAPDVPDAPPPPQPERRPEPPVPVDVKREGSRAHQPKAPPTPRPAIELAALKRLHQRILDPELPPAQRPNLIESLGERRFDHKENLRFLASVLRGRLDGFPDPASARRQAFLALGNLSTAESVQALLTAPLRKTHLDLDEADLLAALTSLEGSEAVLALAGALEGRGLEDDRAYLAIEALARLKEKAAFEGLLAAFLDTARPSPLRRQAAIALGRLGDARAFGPLKAGLKERKQLLRQGAALGLGFHAAAAPEDAADCVALLAKATADRQLLVADAAALALTTAQHSAAIEPLIACLDDPRLRTRARLHLERLGGRHAKGLQTPEQWRQFWEDEDVAHGALPAPQPLELIDATAFRYVPASSRGVVFVVDASGSMKAKWDAVRYELKKALELCPPAVRFQLIFFSDAPRALWPKLALAPATPANVATALEALDGQSVTDVGQTSIGAALDLALRHTGAESIYLISDGLDSQVSPPVLTRAIQRLNRQRPQPATIHGVHVRFGGAPVRIESRRSEEDPEDIRFMQALVWESGGIYARN